MTGSYLLFYKQTSNIFNLQKQFLFSNSEGTGLSVSLFQVSFFVFLRIEQFYGNVLED